MKRPFRLITILLLLCALAAGLFACALFGKGDDHTPQATVVTTDPPKTVLFLGDSIGEAIAGMSPLTEREAYGYYGILGNCNELTYYNRAVTAFTSGNLLSYIKRENEGVTLMKSMITGADLIHISILGNNFLNSSHNQMMIDLANEDYDDIRARQEKATQNLDAILTYIRSLNPDAVIVVQTLYNPTGPDSPLVPARARAVLAEKGIGPADYHDLMSKMIVEINKVFTDYLEAHTVTGEDGKEIRPFELADVSAAFEEIYEREPARWSDLFCDDGVHPSNEGHAVIAGVLQDTFAELGFSSPKALQNYKRDKTAQLRRLFSDLPSIDNVRAAIMAATDFDGVTKAYFDGTRGAVPAYDRLPEPTGETFDKDLEFDLNVASVFGSDLLSIFDLDDSGILFGANGEYTLRLTAKRDLNTMLSIAISSQPSGVNLETYMPVSLALPYIHDIAPTVEPTDLAAVFGVLETLYGIKIEGIDFEKESVKKVVLGFRERGELIIEDPDTFSDTIRVTFTGKYRLAEMTDPATGEKVSAIYVNNGIGRGESYVRYAYAEEDGDKRVKMMIDVAGIVLEGVIYAE